MCKKLAVLVPFFLMLSVVVSASAELVAHWRLDEGSGTVANDSSGYGNDGTLNGDPQWAAGMFGGALEFDGIDDYIEVPDNESLQLWERFTLAAWIYQVESRSSRVIDKIGAGTANGPHLDTHPGTNLRSCSGTCISTAGDHTLDEWHHVAVTFDEGVVRLYVDGSVNGEGSAPSPLAGNSLTLRIGADSNGQSLFYGLIDDARVYSHALTEAEILAAMEGAVTVYPYALGPNPDDGALYEDTWINLSWRPGDFAVSHDVYVGDNFEDVDAGAESTFVGNQTGTFLVVGFPGFPYPDGLVPGTTYYWRIDEVNDSEPNSPWKGKIWSFSIPPKTAYLPDPIDGAEFVDLGATLSWTPGFGAKLHTVYLGDSFEDVNNAGGGSPQGAATYKPANPLESEKVYYWRVDEFDAFETHKGDVWAFTTPGAVGNPQPANGAVDVQMNATLNWTAAETATSHELYFGADAEAVDSATNASPEYIGPRALGAESYDPGGLGWHDSYAWRVDEVYPTETVKGLVWTFTTADFILVDDFESYNDVDPPDPNSNRIFDKWVDGFGTTTNGALVGNDLPPYAEQTIVHGGAQSMPYLYDNNLKTSEATLTLVYPRDWTTAGVTRLSLWFRGASDNAAERMFVALNDTAAVYHDDASVTQMTGWNNWIIDLSATGGFADQGVDLANVNTITIGFGTKNSPAAGGSGKMYFDDIRLYR